MRILLKTGPAVDSLCEPCCRWTHPAPQDSRNASVRAAQRNWWVARQHGMRKLRVRAGLAGERPDMIKCWIAPAVLLDKTADAPSTSFPVVGMRDLREGVLKSRSETGG